MLSIKEYFKQDNFAEYCGIEILEVKKGYSKVKMNIRDELLNGMNIVHGGAIFTLADMAFAAAANSHKKLSVSINSNISFVTPAKGKYLIAVAEETSINYKISTYNITVYNDKDEVVALCEGMAYIKKEKITED